MNTLTKKQETVLDTTNINQMFGNKVQIPIDAPLPQIKVLRETPMFETPDGQTIKSVTGHIIYWHNANQYYASKFGEGESALPDCASSDGIQPDGGTKPQNNLCKDCPLNEYGSGKDGNGKACQNTIRLYFLPDGDVIPSIIKAAPSSIGKKESLMKWLTNAANVASKATNGQSTAYQPIKVQLSLHKKDFDSGFSSSVIDIETLGYITDGATINKLGKLYQEFTANYLGRIAEDIATEGNKENTPSGNEPEVEDMDIPI